MDRDLTIMIYGAIMGVVGSILTSIVTTMFQFWLARREHERKQSEERSRQLRYIHLPTDEEVILINSSRQNESSPELQRKTAETGSVVLSVFIGGVLVYQTNDPMLAFSFAALLGFLVTRRAISARIG
jgi:predicted PurR-regulated permease PerM